MTQPSFPLRMVLLLFLICLVPIPWAGAQQPDEDEHWVAKVGGHVLTRQNLGMAVVWRVRSQLNEAGSGPMTVLRQMIEEVVIAQEARRLGVQVTQGEVRREYGRIDTEVRQRTNGNKALQDVIVRDQGGRVSEFLANLRLQMLKEKVAGHQEWLGLLPKNEQAKLAQIEVVIDKLLKAAKVESGVPSAMQEVPSELPAGVIVMVNDEPITFEQYGDELTKRLPSTDIRKIIEDECKAVLTTQVALSIEEMDAVVEAEKERWNKTREMTTQEAWRHVSYEDFVSRRYRLDLDTLRKDRYFRGYYGLIKANRAQLTPKEVRDDYEQGKDSLYGDRIVITDILIAFVPKNPLLGTSGGRSRKDALQQANEVLRRYHTCGDFERVVREVNTRRDPSFRATRLRVRNTDNERLLYGQAKLLRNGDVSSPFETLSEVHVLRREKQLPAPTFEQVEDLIRQRIARRRTHDWLDEQLKDPKVVQIRWPPPDMTPPR